MPHPNIGEHHGFLAIFLAKIQKECYAGMENDDLHLTGKMFSHEYIYMNDPDVDSELTTQVIQRATNVVRAYSEYSDFTADHVITFTITGLLPKPCQDYTNDDGVSGYVN